MFQSCRVFNRERLRVLGSGQSCFNMMMMMMMMVSLVYFPCPGPSKAN